MIKVNNLSKEFHEQGTSNELLAVDHVDFTIQNGSFCALVGESGSGKSTLAQLMCSLLVPSIAASLKELGFDVTIDAVDMNTWYGALMAGEYDLTFYNTAGGSFDPATDMSNMAPGAMGDPILCQFSAFFENPEIFAELDSTSDSQRVQEIYGMILNGIADQNLLVPVTGTHDLALWNTDKITGYDFYTDASYVDIASVHVK